MKKLALAGLIVSCWCSAVVAGPGGEILADKVESPLRSRVDFIRKLRGVKVGMTQDRVRGLLGAPDDVWIGPEMRSGSPGHFLREAERAWAYGGEGHLTFPTLGMVSFDAKGNVAEVLGNPQSWERAVQDTTGAWIQPKRPGLPPGMGLPPEPETRRVLRAIDRLKGYDHHNDPLRVIQVVNTLQPLGKDAVLALIDEYLRVSNRFGEGQEGLFVVIRCLFEVPRNSGHFPLMAVGGPIPRGPADPRQSPRFPVVLFRDIPFSGVSGYWLAGQAEPVGTHLSPYRKWYSLRKQPLRPPDNPLEVIDDLIASSEWPDWGRTKPGGGPSLASKR